METVFEANEDAHDYFAWATTTPMEQYNESADDVPDDPRIPLWSWDGLVSGEGDRLSRGDQLTRPDCIPSFLDELRYRTTPNGPAKPRKPW